MPICRKCGIRFPNWLTVDGVRRQLCRRKFCLSCSPFGRHNTRDITKESTDATHLPDSECICGRCGKAYVYERKRGHTKARCVGCLMTERRQKIKQWSVTYKGGKCSICGYNRCITAMHFHHYDPLEKDFSISGSRVFSREKIAQELDKCILLCANCHAEVHAGLLVLKGRDRDEP